MNMNSKVDTALEKFDEQVDRAKINQQDQAKWLKLMKPFASSDGKVTLEAFTKAVEEFINQSYDQNEEGWKKL